MIAFRCAHAHTHHSHHSYLYLSVWKEADTGNSEVVQMEMDLGCQTFSFLPHVIREFCSFPVSQMNDIACRFGTWDTRLLQNTSIPPPDSVD